MLAATSLPIFLEMGTFSNLLESLRAPFELTIQQSFRELSWNGHWVPVSSQLGLTWKCPKMTCLILLKASYILFTILLGASLQVLLITSPRANLHVMLVKFIPPSLCFKYECDSLKLAKRSANKLSVFPTQKENRRCTKVII